MSVPPAAVLAVLAAAAVAAPAAANVPDPLTRTNAVRIPWTGDVANGTLTTTVTYSDTAATATASTDDTISLGKDFLFHLRTCVAYHLHGALPVSTCDERTVDTRGNTAAVLTHAPTVTLSAQPRPATQPWGYFTPYTEVQYDSAGSWQVLAQ
ncbi:MAG: hypothetical protein QOJ85_4601, partial [Solirubrobacteraceae bacterium]|nr:hypothetical protein [Solirubrobacteraceae bacterium]